MVIQHFHNTVLVLLFQLTEPKEESIEASGEVVLTENDSLNATLSNEFDQIE